MVDERYDREYQAGRSAFNATFLDAVRSLGEALANAFHVLNRIEYFEPWAINSEPKNSNR